MQMQRRPVAAIAAVSGMVTVVVLLAVLQYRWTGELSRGAEERMRDALAASMRRFREDFSRELNHICALFQPDPAAPPSLLQDYALSRYGDWAGATEDREMLAGVYIWRLDGPAPRLLMLDRVSFRFVETRWPAELATLREYLTSQCWDLAWTSEREAYRHPWVLHEESAAMAQALFYVSPGERGPAGQAQHLGFLILQLDRGRLARRFLPLLVARHFGPGPERGFLVSVREAGHPERVLFESDPAHPVSAAYPDAQVDLLDPANDRWGEPVGAALTPSSETEKWRLAAQHRAGSLTAAVGVLRRRNLAVSFGLLSLLAASMALILALARRMQKLAALQMEFVAGVSHELRTPLSVICSAADNLAEGIVRTAERAREYGDLIRTEGRRLSRMVEQALFFAAEQAGRARYDLRPTRVAEVVAQVLESSSALLKEAGMQVDRSVPEDLPEVVADPGALRQCIENLVNNAVKYAKEGGWLGVRAAVSGDGSQREVQITVEDHGPGIAHSELTHVFEPFFRAKRAREGQIKGAGLGLYLVRRMMESMGGRITAWSKPGRGARFTLHLAAAGGSEIEGADQNRPPAGN